MIVKISFINSNPNVVVRQSGPVYVRLQSAMGPQGPKGDPGEAGSAGPAGEQGEPGISAYEVWLGLGNSGSEQDFIDSLTGSDGAAGADGSDGLSAYQVWLSLGNSGTEQDFIDSLTGSDGANGNDGADGSNGSDGADGASAYEVWLSLGNSGTEAEFIASLQGADGNDGSNGADGSNGLSAYEVWLGLGNSGTEQDFIDSLKGADGADGSNGADGADGSNGSDGLSAYEIWLGLGNTGTEQDFIDSLQGADGDRGADGADGSAATISVGTVTTGAAGSSASVSNVGTSSAAIFDFTIPKGDKGDPGDSLGYTAENVANKENTTIDTSTTKYPTVNLLKTGLDGKVAANTAITGATKTKITYDSKGLVTSGSDATTADISDSTNKRYITDAQQTVLGNTSGTNTGDETQSTIKTKLGAATASIDGYLTASDFTTFNSKQAALTNPITGTGTANQIGYFTNSSTIASLSTSTYPSLTELSYVKGVTSALQAQVDSKQATLVSGTNIKTINGTSVLGSGDITVSAGSSAAGNVFSYYNFY